jgi:hypothetical protein
MISLVDGRIPISKSVAMLDKKFPHLRDVKWNDPEDRAARKKKRELEHGIQHQQSGTGREIGTGCGVESHSVWEDGDEVLGSD